MMVAIVIPIMIAIPIFTLQVKRPAMLQCLEIAHPYLGKTRAALVKAGFLHGWLLQFTQNFGVYYDE